MISFLQIYCLILHSLSISLDKKSIQNNKSQQIFMKRILLSAALVSACMAASAQKVTFVPYLENGFLKGTAISANGKYVGGSDSGGEGFIAEVATGKIKYFVSEHLGDEDAVDVNTDIRYINNNGVGCGACESKANTFDYSTNAKSLIYDKDYSLARWISDDGSFLVGYTYDASFMTDAVYWKDGKMFVLPQLTDDEIGYETNGWKASFAVEDGSIIVGVAHDNFGTSPAVIWHRGADGTYKADAVGARYADFSFDLDGEQKYDMFDIDGVSANGKWACVTMHEKNSMNGNVIGRYDIEADTLQEIVCPGLSQNIFYYANGISNDGTIVGYVEDQERGSGRTGVIVNAGEAEAKHLADVFPKATQLAQLDANEYNTPCAITPDGRYIAGFGYVDYSEESLCYATYVLDTKAPTETCISNATADGTSSDVVASFSADGRKVNPSTVRHGLIINKLANGKVQKVLVK